ncbi:hypothetical protein [Providencia rettgeri]|uniref:Uncharacterized protein n=1 Tax=Escherichia coli TaxID=562 RepID=A0A7L8K964_ECOLX|nr:hypothetical protein [Providencia rettgeri]QOE89443.1 hypothetical protein TP123_133 [Escherichia coli]
MQPSSENDNGGGSRGCGNTRLPCVVAAGGLRHGAGFPVRQADAGGGLRRLRQPMEEHHHERQ